jgi:hypothetical protein
VEGKYNPARDEREAFICRFFFYSRFRARPAIKNRENVYARLRGSWFGKESKHPEMIGFSFEEFHPFFNIC